MLNIKITGSGYYLPSTIETAEEISKKIGSEKSYALGAGSSAMSCMNGHCGELIINENLKFDYYISLNSFRLYKLKLQTEVVLS